MNKGSTVWNNKIVMPNGDETVFINQNIWIAPLQFVTTYCLLQKEQMKETPIWDEGLRVERETPFYFIKIIYIILAP